MRTRSPAWLPTRAWGWEFRKKRVIFTQCLMVASGVGTRSSPHTVSAVRKINCEGSKAGTARGAKDSPSFPPSPFSSSPPLPALPTLPSLPPRPPLPLCPLLPPLPPLLPGWGGHSPQGGRGQTSKRWLSRRCWWLRSLQCVQTGKQ